MHIYWNVEDEQLRRALGRGLWRHIGHAVLVSTAIVLFGWWALLAGGVLLALGAVRKQVRKRRHPVQFAARRALLQGIIERAVERETLPTTVPLWHVPIMLVGLPLTKLEVLVSEWAPPDISDAFYPAHVRIVGHTVYIYDDAAIARGVDLWMPGGSSVPVDVLHDLPHNRGVITVDVRQAFEDHLLGLGSHHLAELVDQRARDNA